MCAKAAVLTALALVSSCGRIGVAPEGSSSDAAPSRSDAMADGAVDPLSQIPTGGSVLVSEGFDDLEFGERGWYDVPSGVLSTMVTAPGSSSAFECEVALGTSPCRDGIPGRMVFAPTETLYVGAYVRFAGDWDLTERIYNFMEVMTDADHMYIGPYSTTLTMAAGFGTKGWSVSLRDNANVDTDCLLLDDDSIVGCDGDFESYIFTEERSVAACNGLIGDIEERKCEPAMEMTSQRSWHGLQEPMSADRWYYLELFAEMNSITNGVGIPDGKLRLWIDGQRAYGSDRILMRTAENASLAFAHLLFGVGYSPEPVEDVQTMWVDELTIRTLPPP